MERILVSTPSITQKADHVCTLQAGENASHEWNFADEILERQSEYRKRGGRLSILISEVRVV